MLETAREATGPRVRQISFFLQNRVGALLGVARKLEELNIHICAVSIQDSADHAVIRMVVDRPSLAKGALVGRGLNVFENKVVAGELSVERGRRQHRMKCMRLERGISDVQVELTHVYDDA